MEEAAKEARTTNLPRKLDFNLPLLSTRRLGGTSGTNSRLSFQDTSDGIPFCWERAPGKPKNIERNDMEDGETPRPRLPPCRWQPQEQASTNSNYINDDGCCYADADVDEEEASDVFSDAVEVLSLTQAIDIVERAEENDHHHHHHNHGLERLNLESFECRDDDSLCRNYMMERFLPDATALAASSALYASKNLSKEIPNSYNNYNNYADQDHVSQSCSSQLSHKGCGLEMFFPWRFKHKLCGIKTPVRHVSPHVRHTKHSSTNTPINHVIKKHI